MTVTKSFLISRSTLSIGCTSLIIAAITASVGWSQDRISYNRHIKPILADNCFACHGFDESTREAGLRLDTFEGATSDESGYPAIVPGNLDESEMWDRITADDRDLVMPPPSSHKQLSDEEIALLKRWIEEGAQYEAHWSFESISRPDVPETDIAKGNAIDSFIAAELNQIGWQLAPEADQRTLIRRVAFTLTGLPPTLEEVEQYLNDDSPEAYQSMVERYLSRPQYGEEMARHWLDLARYGDTHGLHLDNERQMWAYRDWVVDSFNRNQSFDQFTIEQLAGDLLPEPTTEQLIATGFNRSNVTTSEGGAIEDEFRYRYAVDRTSTMAEAWLGLTAGCAVCHDHKFDPISIHEFYSLYAFFNSAADPPMDGNALLTQPVLRLATAEDEKKLADYDLQLESLQRELLEQVASLNYIDPADLNPLPESQVVERVWFDGDFPSGGNLSHYGHPTQFVSQADSAPVFRGERALKRVAEGLAQDVWQQAKEPLMLPEKSRLFAWVYLDPENPPQAVMLQFHTKGWEHRSVWGDLDVFSWGQANTPSRFHAGPLPESGNWQKLEVPISDVGLSPDQQVTGFATTQYGGTVYWDYIGVEGVLDPANDPALSFKTWWKKFGSAPSAQSAHAPLQPDLVELAKAGPNEDAATEKVDQLRQYYLVHFCESTKSAISPLKEQLKEIRLEKENFEKQIPRTFIFRDLQNPRQSFVMQRGQYDDPGDPVEPGVPAFLPPIDREDPQARLTRLDLAQWLVSSENPLTARVVVNRFWQQVFGIGLVASSADFGNQGEWPSHPELLDFLASDFRDSGWDVKRLVRMMLNSATFKQQSFVNAEQLQRDPENRFLGRGPRFRLDAEQIRDNALFVSGLLDDSMGGKGVKPYQPPNVWEPVGYIDSNTRNYVQDTGSALYRRSIYTFLKRTAPPPFMVNFDAPNREQACSRRERSNTPLQALQLLNDVQHVEAARALAERVLKTGGENSPDRISLIYQIVLARQPADDEVQILVQQVESHLVRYHADPEAAEALIKQGESAPNRSLNAIDLAAYTLIASTVLNLDETLNRN